MTEAPPPAKSVAPALWVATAAFAIAAAFEVGLNDEVHALSSARHLCDGGGGHLLDLLIVAAPATLLIGGIVSLFLILTRRSRGSRKRGWLIGAAMFEMTVAAGLIGFNFLFIISSTIWCGG